MEMVLPRYAPIEQEEMMYLNERLQKRYMEQYISTFIKISIYSEEIEYGKK